jgi:prepilin-type N-terminal cleavage/methylation domain-containing protein
MRLIKTVRKSSPKGFTLAESIIVVLLVGILASLGIPRLLNAVQVQTLKKSASEVYQAISTAQSRSTQRREYWQFSLRSVSGVLQYAIHPANIDPNVSPTSINWTSLPSTISVATAQTNLPTPCSSGSCTYTIYQVCFTDQGLPSNPSGNPQNCTIPASFSPPEQITLTINNATKFQRCTIINTVLGSLTNGREQSAANSSGYTCY